MTSSSRQASASVRGFWAELPVLVIVSLIIALTLKALVIQAFFIPSASMEPTLLIGDRVLITKTAYLYREPQRGEVVVFRDEDPAEDGEEDVSNPVAGVAADLGLTAGDERDFIKRIIGLPGDTVQMAGGVVMINGRRLPESPVTDGGYLSRPDLQDFGPVRVLPEHYVVMGDNRPNSADSRYGLGQIPRTHLLGRAFMTIWPPASAGSLPIPDYPW